MCSPHSSSSFSRLFSKQIVCCLQNLEEKTREKANELNSKLWCLTLHILKVMITWKSWKTFLKHWTHVLINNNPCWVSIFPSQPIHTIMVCFGQSIQWSVYYSNVHFVIVSIVISAEIGESSIIHNEGCPPLIVHFYLWWLWWWLEHIKGNTEVLSHCLGCEYFYYTCFYSHWFNILTN